MNDKLKNVLLSIGATFVVLMLFRAVSYLIEPLFTNGFVKDLVSEMIFAGMALAAVFILKKTDMFQSDPEALKKGWLSAGFEIGLCLFILVLGLGNLLNATATIPEIICFIVFVLLVGFTEEILFRGLIQRSFHEYFGEDSWHHVIFAIIASGVVFGLFHISNVFRTGVSFNGALVQAIVNCFSGMYFCSIYFRTGKNVWFLAFLHGIYDGLAMISSGRLNGVGLESLISNSGGNPLMAGLVWGAIYTVVLVIVLRPQKINPLLKQKPEK